MSFKHTVLLKVLNETYPLFVSIKNTGYIWCFFFYYQNIHIDYRPCCCKHKNADEFCLNDVGASANKSFVQEHNCNATFVSAVFHCKFCKFLDVSKLVFWSMNTVGGISCLCCFFSLFPLLSLCLSVTVRLLTTPGYFITLFVPCLIVGRHCSSHLTLMRSSVIPPFCVSKEGDDFIL